MALKASDIDIIEPDYRNYTIRIMSKRGTLLDERQYQDQYAMEKAFKQINTSWLRYLESKGEQDEKGNKGLETDD